MIRNQYKDTHAQLSYQLNLYLKPISHIPEPFHILCATCLWRRAYSLGARSFKSTALPIHPPTHPQSPLLCQDERDTLPKRVYMKGFLCVFYFEE